MIPGKNDKTVRIASKIWRELCEQLGRFGFTVLLDMENPQMVCIFQFIHNYNYKPYRSREDDFESVRIDRVLPWLMLDNMEQAALEYLATELALSALRSTYKFYEENSRLPVVQEVDWRPTSTIPEDYYTFGG